MPWLKIGSNNYYVLLGLPDKGRAINELIVFNDLDQEPLDLLNGLAKVVINPPLRYDSLESLDSKFMSFLPLPLCLQGVLYIG